jgi:thiol-disulfide isomerase/thioredoxin
MLRLLAVLYTALGLAANAAAAAGPDPAALEALRAGSMEKLTFQSPEPLPETGFTDRSGGSHSFADWRGQWLLVNFWATWCAPCRQEMPGLDALQAEFGDRGLSVLAIATGHNAPAAMDRFLAETGVDHLTIYLDPKQDLARQAGVLALPVTLLVDPQGRVQARLIGGADWSGASARAIVAALLGG